MQDCAAKNASFGYAYERKGAKPRRWCKACAQNHIGAEDVVHDKCVTCRKVRPVFGMEEDRRRQWCSGCAKGVEGAVNINLLQRMENKMGALRLLHNVGTSRSPQCPIALPAWHCLQECKLPLAQ